jgi:hypothetical protein
MPLLSAFRSFAIGEYSEKWAHISTFAFVVCTRVFAHVLVWCNYLVQ